MNLNSGQDWDTVIIRKKTPKQADLKDSKAVNQALRSGAEVETVKKFTAATNKTSVAGPIKNAVKLENETENFHHERVSMSLARQIVTARTDKKLTQAQLAQLINEKANVIQEYESGKAIPAPQVLSKMSRVLGVVLKKNA